METTAPIHTFMFGLGLECGIGWVSWPGQRRGCLCWPSCMTHDPRLSSRRIPYAVTTTSACLFLFLWLRFAQTFLAGLNSPATTTVSKIGVGLAAELNFARFIAHKYTF
jgi:hypothetical protein